MRASLKKTLILYIIIAVIVVVVMTITTFVFCNNWKNIVYDRYKYNTYIGYKPVEELSFDKGDKILINIINYTQTFSVLLYATMAIVITVNLFFKNKLKHPVELLMKEAAHIKSGDMSFECIYNSGDEMGEICYAFDEMRLQLCNNHKKLWRIMEKQRQLNNAFAHDVRTPITVIQGYTDLIQKYYPEGKISKEKLLETMCMIDGQTKRLKSFCNTIKKFNDFESMEVKLQYKDFQILSTKIEENMKGLKHYHGIDMELRDRLPKENRKFDDDVILEVVDNLISNAISYAVDKVQVTMEYDNELLCIYVADDGPGFSREELYKASSPYYIGRKDRNDHFGMGLTICSILCEKHGGYLKLYNSTKGGAIACAIFSVL